MTPSTRRASLCLAVFTALGLAAARPAAATYTFTAIDDPSATNGTAATGINAAGQIVGYYSNAGGEQGFLDIGGSFTTIDGPSATTTDAEGINASGQVTGYYVDSTGQHGFVDTQGGSFFSLNMPGAIDTRAYGINDSGQVVGVYFDTPTSDGRGFLYTPGTGYSTFDAPGATSGTLVRGVNDAGQIVGSYTDATGYHGYLDTAGSFTTINDPAAPNGTTIVQSINNVDQIVGNDNGSSFLDNGGSFTTINDPASPLALSAQGINDAGQIVGYTYDNATGQHGFLATPDASPAPEPSQIATLALIGVSLGVLLLRARKRRLTANLSTPFGVSP